MEIVNARITNVRIEKDYEFNLMLTLDFGDKKMDMSWDMRYFAEIMNTIGVPNFDSLEGSACRIKIEDMSYRGIGNFIRDEWFTIMG